MILFGDQLKHVVFLPYETDFTITSSQTDLYGDNLQ